MLSLFKRKPSLHIARRLLALAASHGVQEREIPRLFPGISYAALDTPQSVAKALTPAVVDSAAEMFGVRREYLEGLDEFLYFPFGSGRVPATESTREIVKVIVRSGFAWLDAPSTLRGPLAVLTADLVPDRHAGRMQRLVPVIVEPSGTELDGPVYRCRIFGGYFDWSDADQRIGLKALAWLVWNRLNKVVPLYQISEHELVGVLNWMAVPSAALLRPIITNPSLEDYVVPAGGLVSKESDELPKVEAFLESSGLLAQWDAAFTEKRRTAEAGEPGDEAVRPQELKAGAPAKPLGEKRAASEAIKSELKAVARGIWASEPMAKIVDVVGRIKAMPHLKGSALSESAIHKAIRSVAPPGASKPGRRPNKPA